MDLARRLMLQLEEVENFFSHEHEAFSETLLHLRNQ